jgi:hypothetical protein
MDKKKSFIWGEIFTILNNKYSITSSLIFFLKKKLEKSQKTKFSFKITTNTYHIKGCFALKISTLLFVISPNLAKYIYIILMDDHHMSNITIFKNMCINNSKLSIKKLILNQLWMKINNGQKRERKREKKKASI